MSIKSPRLLGSMLLATASACFAELPADIAVRVVTPEPLLAISGGLGSARPATQKTGEPTARACVLADGETTIAIVSADFLGFPATRGPRVRKKIKGLRSENMLIGATPTHSAPDTDGFSDGHAQLLTIPGEALPNLGFTLKRNMRGEPNLLFGLCNDAFGYILTRFHWRSFKDYDYVSRTCLGEQTGEILIEAALKFVAESPVPEKL